MLGGLLWSLLPLPALQPLDQWWLVLSLFLKLLSLDRGSKGPQTRTEDSSEPYFRAPKYVLKHQECIAKWCPAQQTSGSWVLWWEQGNKLPFPYLYFVVRAGAGDSGTSSWNDSPKAS